MKRGRQGEVRDIFKAGAPRCTAPGRQGGANRKRDLALLFWKLDSWLRCSEEGNKFPHSFYLYAFFQKLQGVPKKLEKMIMGRYFEKGVTRLTVHGKHCLGYHLTA